MLMGTRIALVDSVDVVPAVGGLLAFGFRISRLLRLCPLDMVVSFASDRSVRSAKNERLRRLHEVRA